MSNVEIMSVLFRDEFDFEFVRAALLGFRSWKVVGTQLRIVVDQHDDDMNVTARDHAPEVLNGQRQW